MTVAVLPDRTEGKLLGGAIGGGVVVGLGVVQMLRKEQFQLFRRVRIQAVHPGISISGGKQSRLPAHQRRQTAQGVHETVGQQIRTGLAQDFSKNTVFQRVFFRDCARFLVDQARQGRAFTGFIQTDPPQTVDDPSVGAQQIQVAGAAHQLRHQPFLHRVTHFVSTVEDKLRPTLHGHPVHFRQSAAADMFAQKHTEHGRLRGIFRIGCGQVEPGIGGIWSEQKLVPAVIAFQLQNHRIPAGLVDLVHSRASCLVPDLIQNRRQKESIKCHWFPPS